MPIVASDIKKYLSGGAANADKAASLGGAISSVEVVDNTINNLFAVAPASEAEAGSVKYRAIFIKNTHATLTLNDAVIYISSNTPSLTTEVKIALAGETGSPIETVANEDAAPVGEVFSTADGLGNALSIGNLAAGAVKGVWIQYTITAGAEAVNDEVILTVRGETEA